MQIKQDQNKSNGVAKDSNDKQQKVSSIGTGGKNIRGKVNKLHNFLYLVKDVPESGVTWPKVVKTSECKW